jgi:hypothetical protein
VVLIIANWEQKILKIKSLQLEAISLAPKVNLKKLEDKIKQW